MPTTFDTLETSREASRPIEIYSFALGSVTYNFTSAEDSIVLDAVTYAPEAISRSAISSGSDAKSATTTVVVPAGNAFAALYVGVVPGVQATLTIIRLQRDEVPVFTTRVLVYKGKVNSVQFSDDGLSATIALRSLEGAASRTIPRYTYMGLCNNVLYDASCKVDPAGFSFSGPATAVSGNTVTVQGASLKPNQYYRGGFCKPSDESDFRMILDHTGDVLTLLLPFTNPILGRSVNVFAGCNHVMTGDCATKFDNVLEFAGFPYVPTRNVFTVGLV